MILCIRNFLLLYILNFSVLRDAGGYIDWPSGRGIFINKQRNFLVWINEEDHIRVISMQSGGNLLQVYQRLATVNFVYII